MACCIKGCKSRREKNSLCKKSFFTAYTNDMFISWSNVLSDKNIKISRKSTICELHFKPEDVIKEDVFLQDDGAVIYVKTGKPKLKKGAIPSIFPSEKVPYYQQMEHRSECKISQPIPSTSHEANKEKKNISKFSAQDLSFGNNIELPTSYWITNINNSHMMWTCWANDLSHILRRVILTPIMELQVFIGNEEISFDSKRINNILEMKQILMELQNFFPCEHTNDEVRVTNCNGFVINRQYKEKQKMRCLPCKKKIG